MDSHSDSAHDERPQFTIGAVAKRTGLTTHAIRKWERRYGVIVPKRSAGGTRLYSAADILRLRLLRQATERGVAIGQAVGLEMSELIALTEDGAAAPTSPREADTAGLPPYGGVILAAVETMDGETIQAELMRAAISLGAAEFARSVAVPLLEQVGNLWASDRICPAHEHLFSVRLRLVLERLLEVLPARTEAPLALATTPSGEPHELGALLAAVISASAGWRVTYLGPDLPAEDIATAVRATSADAVLLSVSRGQDVARVDQEVASLASRLPPDVMIVIGGGGISEQAESFVSSGAVYLGDLDSLAAEMRRLAKRGGDPSSARNPD